MVRSVNIMVLIHWPDQACTTVATPAKPVEQDSRGLRVQLANYDYYHSRIATIYDLNHEISWR